MFDFLPSPLKEISTAALTLAGVAASATYVYTIFKQGTMKVSESTIDTLESNVSALQGSVAILERESKVKDNKISKLEGKVEQLEKENTSLRETLSLRSPEFESTLKNLADILPKLVTRVEEINDGANERYSNIEECSSKILGLLEAK